MDKDRSSGAREEEIRESKAVNDFDKQTDEKAENERRMQKREKEKGTIT